MVEKLEFNKNIIKLKEALEKQEKESAKRSFKSPKKKGASANGSLKLQSRYKKLV